MVTQIQWGAPPKPDYEDISLVFLTRPLAVFVDSSKDVAPPGPVVHNLGVPPMWIVRNVNQEPTQCWVTFQWQSQGEENLRLPS